MHPRELGALEADPRVELLQAFELTREWASIGQRASAVLVVARSDPFNLLARVVMSGLTQGLVMAVPQPMAGDAEDLLAAGAEACLTLPLTIASIESLMSVALRRPRSARSDGAPMSLEAVTLTVRHRDATVRLTRRQFALLHCLSERKGRAVSAEELLSVAWADKPDATSSRDVLDFCVHGLRKKLSAAGFPDALSTVRGFGYCLEAGATL